MALWLRGAGFYNLKKGDKMKTYFKQHAALGLPTTIVISSTAQDALNYAAAHGLEWCVPDDSCIEETVIHSNPVRRSANHAQP